MGRPIKKSKMANTSSGAAGNIAVTSYRPSGASNNTSTTAYIISQRGSKMFKISLEDSTTGVYCLKAVAPGSLSATPPNGAAGEFCVQVILSDSTVAYVERFYNNTIHYVTAAGASGTCTYTLGVEGTDEQATAGTGTIDVITLQ
jgi:hypothetical protein|tara:strand:- start:669 stop:1103 length:435 start_codon:yes stop_codon:yes gene_type:complete